MRCTGHHTWITDGAFDYYATLFSDNENAAGEPDVFNISLNAYMAMVEQCRAQDELFEQTGVEEEQLLYSIEQLKLERDPEFLKIASESQTRAMALAQQA